MVISTEDWLHSGDATTINVVYLLSSMRCDVVVVVEDDGAVVVVYGWRTLGVILCRAVSPSCKNGEKREGERCRRESERERAEREERKRQSCVGCGVRKERGTEGESEGADAVAHAPALGIDPMSRQHLVAPHVPR